jgi:RHS repeat-associated protein
VTARATRPTSKRAEEKSTYDSTISLPLPGRRTNKARIVTITSILVLLTLSSGLFPVFPQLLSSIFPAVSEASLQKSTAPADTTNPANSQPSVPLPPGTIRYGFHDTPSFSEALDASLSPHLTSTSSAFVYQTAYGIFSFNRSTPFVFTLNSLSGTELTKGSFFFVQSSVPLTPGNGNVTVATNCQYRVSYDALFGSIVVGSLAFNANFFANVRPKFTATFSPASTWTFGDFHIVWSTVFHSYWAKGLRNGVLNLEAIPHLQRINGTLSTDEISRADVGPSADASTWNEWVTTDWGDSPGASVNAGQVVVGNISGRGLEVAFSTNKATIDPTQVATSTATFATGYSTQRKTFNYGGYYFLFWYDGSNVVYATTQNGITWSTPFSTGSGLVGYSFDVYNSGSRLALTWLDYSTSVGGDGVQHLLFRNGTVIGNSINWSPTRTVATLPQPYSWPPSVAIGTDGSFWAGGIWYPSPTNYNYNVWIYRSTNGATFNLSTNYPTSNSGSRDEALQLVPLAGGQLMALTSHWSDSGIRWTIWNPVTTGAAWSSVQSYNLNLPTFTPKWNLISATTTPDSFVHVLFCTTGAVGWAYYNTTATTWSTGPSVYSGSTTYPTVSSDALGNLYAFWMVQVSSVPTYLMYASKAKYQAWTPSSQPFGSGSTITNANWLSATRGATTEVFLAWTNTGSSPNKIYYGSLPLPSGTASIPQTQTWNRFQVPTGGENIEPGNGLLGIGEKDITVPGRGMDLSITRLYLEPFTLLQGIPFNYESSPYANLGNGWQLGLPWVGNLYFHSSTGAVFPLAWASYNSTTIGGHLIKTWTLTVHSGGDFVLNETQDVTASTTSYKDTEADGTAYNFNNLGLVTSIVDRTGQNQITFSYTPSNTISTITDTVGRIATLNYDGNGHLSSVNYGGQTVTYSYSGSNLVSATDNIGRSVQFNYSAQNNWLISGVIYPTGGNSTYTYGSVNIGTDAVNYYVTLQKVFTTSLVRSTSYSYQITDGTVTFTNITQADGGGSVQGYTTNEYSPRSKSMTTTYLNSTNAQIRKTKTWFDASGRPAQTDVYNGNTPIRSFYTRSSYDSWGNLIYSRDAIGHETYNSFANSDSQYMYQSPGNLTQTTNGQVFYDDFNGASLDPTAWVQGGNGAGRTTTTSFSLLNETTYSTNPGNWQTNWVRSAQKYNFPFYGEVQMSLGANPGQVSLDADFLLSPEATATNGDPSFNSDVVRIILNDGPYYRVADNFAILKDSGYQPSNTTSVSWKVILTDTNHLTVYLNTGGGYRLFYSTTSLGLSSNFNSAYVYLGVYNTHSTSYSATFDYAGLYGSNTVTVNGLQRGQKVELYDSSNILQSSATVASGQSSVSLDGTLTVFPYDYLAIYEQDARSLQTVSPTREIWGGTVLSYTPPFRSSGLYRTTSGFLNSTIVYVDDSVPAGATISSDGGDLWVWAGQPYAPTASGTSSHIGFNASGEHEHYFYGSSSTLYPSSGSFHIQYINIAPTSPPSEVMLQIHDGNQLLNPGFETGDFTSWSQTNMIIRADYKNSGQYSAAPSYNSQTQLYSAFTLQQNFPTPIPGYKTSAISLYYYAGLSQYDTGQVLYSDGTHTSTTIGGSNCNSPAWTLLNLGFDNTKQITGIKIVRSAAAVCNLILDDFSFSGQGWEHRAYWGCNCINWGIDGTTSRRNMGPMPPAQSSWVELIVKTDDVGTNGMRLDGLDYILYNGGAYWDFSALGGPSVGTLTVNGLLAGQKVELYDVNWNLKTSGTVGGGLTSVALDVYGAGINMFPFKGYLKIYAASGSLQYSSPIMSDIWGGDAYTYVQPSFQNSFDFGTIGSTIHIAPLGHAEYQNSTSIIESYSTYSSSANLLQQKQRYDSPTGLRWISTTRTYDAYGNMLTLSNARGNTTYYSYPASKYSNAYLTNETKKDGSTQFVTLYGYNFTTGNKLWIYDPRGYNTTYQYDTAGRLTRINYPNSLGSVTYTYVDSSKYVDTIDASGRKTRQIYDLLGRPSTLEKFLGPIPYSNQTSTYNWQDRVASRTDERGNTTSYQYDFLGRLTKITKPDGKTIQESYNDLAFWARSADEDSNYQCSIYDKVGRLTSTIEKASPDCQTGIVSNNAYDQVGDLTRVTNSLSQSTIYVFDNLGRLTKTTYPDNTKQTYTYDNNGNMANMTDRGGTRTMVAYDSLNRVKTKTYCGVQGTPISATSYTYDKNGNVLQIQNENETLTYIYDARNRVLNETAAVNPATRNIVDLGCFGSGGTLTRTGGVSETYTTGFTYSGELLSTIMYPTTSQSNPDITIKYGYDGLGRVLNVTRLGTSTYYARSFTYYKNDQVKGFQYGNGLIANYTYDKLSRPQTISLSGTTTMSLTYTYNNTGTVASVIGTVNGATVNEQYRYDALKRLTNYTITSGGSTTTGWYEYDNIGNRVRQKLNSTITRYSYNPGNELTNSTKYSTPLTTTNYSYDSNGNMKTQNVTSSGTIRWAYTWSSASRLTTVTNSTGLARYAYDGGGKRVEAIEGSSTWFFAYQDTNILYKYQLNYGNYAYIYAGGLKICVVVNVSWDTYYYHTDALGSTRIITYTDSTYVYVNNYQPFGQDNGRPQGVYQNRATDKYDGKPYSAATGLYYYYQRWYDPSIGRFISSDPKHGAISSPQSLNLYIYVVNSPVTLSDPNGLDGCLSGVVSFFGCVYNTGASGVHTVVTTGTSAAHTVIDVGTTAVHTVVNTGASAVHTVVDAGGSVVTTVSNAYNSLSPEEKQILWIGVGVVAIVATGGAAAPLVLGIGLAAGVGAVGVYAGYSYATGQQMTLSGALTAFSIGFAVGSIVGGVASSAGLLGDVGAASKSVEFAPANSATGFPGGVAKALGHMPEGVDQEDWLSGVWDIANHPSSEWTLPNEGGGTQAYGVIDDYITRVVIGKWGTIINAFPDSGWEP